MPDINVPAVLNRNMWLVTALSMALPMLTKWIAGERPDEEDRAGIARIDARLLEFSEEGVTL